MFQRAWRQAQDGDGQAVLLAAAGIGKSRLLRALRDTVGNAQVPTSLSVLTVPC